MHARSLRDGLRSLQLAFREASVIPDPIGKGPGEKWTGPVNYGSKRPGPGCRPPPLHAATASTVRRTASASVPRLLTAKRTTVRPLPGAMTTPNGALGAQPLPQRDRVGVVRGARHTWVNTTSLSTSSPGIARNPSASAVAASTSPSTRSIDSLTTERAQRRPHRHPRARRDSSGT